MALAIVASRIAVPVAEAQLTVNTAASARSFWYADSPMRAGSTGAATTGKSRKIVRCTSGTASFGARIPWFSVALTDGSPHTITATLRNTHGIQARRAGPAEPSTKLRAP